MLVSGRRHLRVLRQYGQLQQSPAGKRPLRSPRHPENNMSHNNCEAVMPPSKDSHADRQMESTCCCRLPL
eukprot:scaffold121189_cov17-Prasinocladus_malaysianus.AAC.1